MLDFPCKNTRLVPFTLISLFLKIIGFSMQKNRPPGTIDPYKPFSENCWIFHAKKLWGQHNFPVNSLVQLLSWAFWKISSNGKWLLSPISSQGPKSTLYEQDPTFWFDRLVVRIPEFSREHLDNKWLHAWSNIVYKSPYSSGTHIMGWDQSLPACFSYFIRGESLINMGPWYLLD